MARTPARTKSDSSPQASSGDPVPNAVWFKPVMFGFMLVGLAWIIVYYMSQASLPIASLGTLNIVIGVGIMFIGFLMTMRWR